MKETTPNTTKEVEELKKEFIAEYKAGHKEGGMRSYLFTGQNGSLIADWWLEKLHHQLQKAREEEKSSILKLALTMGDCPINNPEADAGWMKFQHDFCLKLTKDNKKSILSENDQSELDQPTV